MSKNEIKLGDKVKDKISGFIGIVVACTDWMHGCTRIGVQPTKLKDDGTLIDAQWFDLPQLEKIKDEFEEEKRGPGGPTPIPQRNKDPMR